MNQKHILWRWIAPVLGLLFVLTLVVVLPGCSGGDSKKQLGQSCQGTTECTDGLECRGKRCKTPLENNPPKAIANINPTEVEVGQKVTLDGSGSSDPENTPLTFLWKLIDRPAGSTVKIVDADQETASFVPDKEGDYKLQLQVSDGTNKKTSVAITVRAKKGSNAPPVAKAGPDQDVDPGALVTLDGSASNDPDGDKITYIWKFVTKPAGSKAVIEKPDTAKPTFTADLEGNYVIELEVTDTQKSSNTDSLSVKAIRGRKLIPTITSVTPDKGTIETALNVKITGTNFVEGATVTLGTKRFTPKFVSSTELTVRLNLSGQTPGDTDLLVTNPNNKSNTPAFKFKVLDIPTPELTKLDPNFSFEGVKKVTVKVTGKNFVSTSEVVFISTPLLTTYKSETELVATLNLTNVSEGEYDISVRSPGGRQSKNKLKFKVLKPMPAPILRVLNPPSGKTGEKIDFSVHGTGFAKGAVIVFHGTEVPSKRIRRDEIDADPKLDLSTIKDGIYDVWVKNPDGKISAKLKFSAIGTNPVPKIDRILPFSVYIGTVTKLSIFGINFNKAKAKFFIDGKQYTLNTARSSDTYLETSLDTTKGTWKVGDFNAWVVNPGKTPADDKKSNSFKLTITHPTPSIDALTPGGWNIGCDTDVLVTGRNFVKSTKLYFGSTIYSTTATNPEFKLTYINDTKMTFKLLKKNLSLTTYKVYLLNGPGAKSSILDFPVQNSSNVPSIREVRPATGAGDTIVSTRIYYSSSSNRFLPGAVAYLNGKKMPTSCRLSFDKRYCYDLTAQLDLNGLKPGNHKVTVANPCGKHSPALTFIVTEPPLPMISQIVPGYAKVGDKSALTVKGVNLSKKATVYYGTKKLAINFKSSKEITTQSVLSFGGVAKVDIYVDNGNGKKTAKIPFSILAAKPKISITQVSKHTLKRGQIHKSILVQGSGFTANTKIYFDNKVIAATYQTGAQMTITQLDFRSIKAGTYTIYAEDAGVKSNAVVVLAEPLPPPSIRYLSPSSRQIGKYTTTYLYIYGNLFCSATSRCSSNPTVKIIGPDKKDYSSKFRMSYSYSTFIRGDFNLQGIPAGPYQFTVILPTGEKSGPGVFQLTPPPPPVATSVSPSLAFRGNDQQQISIIGANLVVGDLVIFNNKILNRIPGTPNKTNTSINATINISRVKYAGKYPLYVLRCMNAGCTKVVKTNAVFINVQDPPCAPLGVTCSTDMKPAGSEACATVNSQRICRPKCTSSAQCKALSGAPTNATCSSGTCR